MNLGIISQNYVVRPPQIEDYYISGTNQITVIFSNPNPFPVRIWYDFNDSTPDQDYYNADANETNITRLKSGLNPGSSYRVYLQCEAPAGSTYKSVVHRGPSILNPAQNYQWVFITVHSSDPGSSELYDEGYFGGDWTNVNDFIEANYDPNTYLGNSIIVNDLDAGEFHEYESQLI